MKMNVPYFIGGVIGSTVGLLILHWLGIITINL